MEDFIILDCITSESGLIYLRSLMNMTFEEDNMINVKIKIDDITNITSASYTYKNSRVTMNFSDYNNYYLLNSTGKHPHCYTRKNIKHSTVYIYQ